MTAFHYDNLTELCKKVGGFTAHARRIAPTTCRKIREIQDLYKGRFSYQSLLAHILNRDEGTMTVGKGSAILTRPAAQPSISSDLLELEDFDLSSMDEEWWYRYTADCGLGNVPLL